MRPHGSPGQLEERRRKIIAFLKRNLSLHEIARRLGCHARSVMRWRDAFRSKGPEGLKAKPASGRPPKLSAPQKQRLVALLAQGAVAHGYRTELWTTQRIAELIAQQPVLKELIGSLKIPMSEVQRLGATVVSLKVSARKALDQ